jgi:uncharacterized Ntn-hydrolase superfamily protein
VTFSLTALLDGLYAGLATGGEAGPVHSAGLAVTHPSAGWAETELRVDWHDDPLGELRLLWQRWQPVREDYITRGLHPASAPAYGVPGDEALSLEEAQDPGLGGRQPVPQARSARRSG